MKLKALLFKMLAFCLTIVVGTVFTVNRQQTVVFADEIYDEEALDTDDIADILGISVDFAYYLEDLFPEGSYTLDAEDESFIYFEGVTDEIMLSDVTYYCSLDLEAMEFYFEVNDGTHCDTITADAVMTEHGEYTATLEDIPGLDYDLAYYADLVNLEDLYESSGTANINARLWWLIPVVIAVVVTTYLIVAKTAEQKRADRNYIENQELEEDSSTTHAVGNYIFLQGNGNAAGYKIYNGTVNNLGCTVVAVYNLTVAKGLNKPFSEVIYDCESLGIGILCGGGEVGSNGYQVRKVLRKYGWTYTQYLTYSSFDTALKNANQGTYFIINKRNLNSPYNHSVFMYKSSSTNIKRYNEDQWAQNNEESIAVNDWANQTGVPFFSGYVIH